MASPNPHITPRVIEVLDPSVNQHVVMVMMSAITPQKFPNKPWGTPINEIGLTKIDSDKYPDYILVDFEKAPDGPDLFWIFQNLDTAPVWDTVSKSRDNLVPPKFSAQVTQTTLEQEVLPGTAPTSLTGDLVSSTVARNKNTGKSTRTEVSEVISTGTALTGRIAYVERNSASTSESLVVDGTAISTGLQIVDSKVTPLGNGKSVKETVTADAWPEHTGSRWDENLGASVLFTEQFIAPGASLTTPYTDVSIVNKDRNMRHTEVVPTTALATYMNVVPHQVNLGDLPRELISVNVIWNYQYSIGTQDFSFFKTATGKSWSLSSSADDSASSSASITPEVQLRFRDIASSNLPGFKHEFYVAVPVTEAKILARLKAKRWPVFKPESTTITASGQSIRVSVNAQASLSGTVANDVVVEQGWSKGTSDDFSVGLSNNSIQVPACIHKAIQFTGQTSLSQVVSATALIGMSHSIVGSITSTRTKSGTAFGAVYPTFLPPTGSATTIPTSGKYVMDADVGRPRWGYCLVTAIVFNASVLA